MPKKILYAVISLAILLAAAGFGSTGFGAEPTAAPTDSAAPTVLETASGQTPAAPTATPTATPAPTLQNAGSIPVLKTETHFSYMSADSQGNFHPRAGVTRAEACQILYELLENPVEGSSPFTDVAEADDCYAAVSCLTALGVLQDDGTGLFRPDDFLTGAEFARWLACFSLDAGSVTDSPLSRAAFCTVLNRVLGRSCDEAAVLLGGVSPYPDVSAYDPYFADVMEASTPHDFTFTGDGTETWDGFTYEPGLHALYGRLYKVDADGVLCRNQSDGVFSFGPDGRYTTGDEELDGYLFAALYACVTSDLSGRDALQAVYLYVKNTYSYRNLGEPVIGYELAGWEYDRALSFFKNNGGTCYGFAAAFGLLARSLGYEAYIISGAVNEYYYPHSWVVIPENGVNYIYDVELEYARPSRHENLSLFSILNFSVYSYWYDPWW